jgi:predicted lipid carrier protein YhbT
MHRALPPLPAALPRLFTTAIGLPGRWIPYAAQKPLLTLLLNEALRVPLENDELAFLGDSVVQIAVDDLNLDWRLKLDGQRLRPVARSVPTDVSVSGSGLDFARLALRLEDPDTLFFQRRIQIEGDTEAGLGVKNTLDALDWDDLPAGLRLLVETAARIAGRLARFGDRGGD